MLLKRLDAYVAKNYGTRKIFLSVVEIRGTIDKILLFLEIEYFVIFFIKGVVCN